VLLDLINPKKQTNNMKKTKLSKYFSYFKIKQCQFAKEIGLHTNHLSRILNGKSATSTMCMKLMRLTLQNLLDKKFQEHEKKGIKLQEQQRLLNEALEELCQTAQPSKPLTLQNLFDKKFQEHKKRGMELQEQQRLLNEALEELCQTAQPSKPLDSLSHSQPSQQDLLSCGTESEH